MSHVVQEKTGLLGRVRRIRGQMEAIERSLEQESGGCADILMLIASVRGAVNGLMAEVMTDHIRHHVLDPDQNPASDQSQGVRELMAAIQTYLR